MHPDVERLLDPLLTTSARAKYVVTRVDVIDPKVRINEDNSWKK
jgi:hypothetical protein